ncbi:MAG: amino acid-binding protein [Lachnospiraceae bacterium]|nr:amino acid-binding protein [Lachnospiraceae bacterium]
MKATQISIFLENKSGRLAAATQTIEDIGANLRALNIADTSEFGILRIIVDDPQKTCTSLKAAGFTAKITDVLALSISDEPGALNKVLKILDKNNINLEYLYAFIGKDDKKAVIILRVQNTLAAESALTKEGILPLTHEEMISI